MSATILGVKAWSTATRKEIKDAIDQSMTSAHTYDGQRLFDILNTRPNAWEKPTDGNDAVCIWNYPSSNEAETYEVTTPSGKTETACLFWEEREALPSSFCILETE